MAIGLFSKLTSRKGRKQREEVSPIEHKVATFQPSRYEKLNEDPLLRMLQQGRYAILLSEESKTPQGGNSGAMFDTARDELEKSMAIVPAGSSSIPQNLFDDGDDVEVPVEPYLLDVHTVTNGRFQKFVDGGGYDALEFWPEEIWPHLIELKDLTGQPGPRFWRQGRCDERLWDHPVVGLSWYEAQAFAIWIGQRLPTEAEWQMAASWHINSSADIMRRFPWGDAMNSEKCNIWTSRKNGTVPVDEYPSGVAPNHVYQLVGNVWEWTDSEYVIADGTGNPVVGEMPMHAVRGGAFDTYFESQATAHFRTGQIALARTHNTGFRCAMDLNDATWINGG
jgi:formylglycine-generating enzyme required for sulfatase activity